jgi:hypothetical protein
MIKLFCDKKEADVNSVIEFLEVNGDKSFKQTCLDIEQL